MKVVLSESQLLNILNEITSEQRMDFLLDKVSEGGIDSLTPAEKIELRKLSGEDISSDEENAANLSSKMMDDSGESNDEILNVSNVIGYIFDNMPEGMTYDIQGERWEIFLEDKEKILVTDGDRGIFIYPFYNGDSKIVIKSTERSPFRINLNNIPSNKIEIEDFMENLINYEIPKIINYILTTS